ncbi:leucine-rich repeat receptor-like protein kinase PXL1 [Vicia villosa]|uniref:leucine-rich repeat receptor-like protein kinase PXL1 n=1 Tax=Vicia villosa TaxID=3911 RepID=UPI00273AFA46|nr:leucine-rich repeat receptor-like protein kinase PXL1 [Vicia villosa]
MQSQKIVYSSLTDSSLQSSTDWQANVPPKYTLHFLGLAYSPVESEKTLKVLIICCKDCSSPLANNIRSSAVSIVGPFPTAVTSLLDLTRLDLHNNKLTGPIPPQIGRLKRLRILNLRWNKLQDAIPPEIGELKSLTHLPQSILKHFNKHMEGAFEIVVNEKSFDNCVVYTNCRVLNSFKDSTSID